MRLWVFDKLLQRLLFATGAAVIAWHLCGNLQPRVLAGWDTSPHLWVFLRATRAMKELQLYSFDSMWFAGYPLFSLYPPLAYLLFALPHLLTFGAIGPISSFNLSFLLLAGILGAAVLIAARTLLGRRAVGFALFGYFLFLTYPSSGMENGYGLGLAALQKGGLIANFAASVFLLLFLAALNRLHSAASNAPTAAAALSLGAIFWTHQISALFALFAAAVYLALHRRAVLRRWTTAILAGTLLASPMLLEQVQHLRYASVTSQGWWPLASDPLAVIFPRITADEIAIFLNTAGAAFSAGFGHGLAVALQTVPIHAPLMLIGAVAGCMALLYRRRYFLPLLTAFGLLLLPRALPSEVLNLPIHAYRFTHQLALIVMLIAAHGWRVIYVRLRRYRHPRMLYAALATPALIAILWIGVARFHLEHPRDGTTVLIPYRYLDQAPLYADAERLVRMIAARSPSGRVAAEGGEIEAGNLGSPHFFSTLLPLHGVPSVFGLLAESTRSSGMLLPSLWLHSRQLRWGGRSIIFQPKFSQLTLERTVQQLALYNVEYIIASSAELTHALEALPREQIEVSDSSGYFTAFRVKAFAAKVEQFTGRPFLYYEEGGVPFRDFAEEWFLSPQLYGTAVAAAHRPFSELTAEEKAAIAGVIISLPHHRVFSAADYRQWHSLGKPVVIIGRVAQELRSHPLITSVPPIRGRLLDSTLAQILLSGSGARIPVTPTVWSEEAIEFDAHGPVLINLSFAPRWRASSQNEVFEVAPSLMLVIADGPTRIEYR